MSDKKEIDLKKLKQFLQLKPTLKDTATFFECSQRCVERRIREEFDMTFFNFREAQLNKTRHSLIQKALSESLGTKCNTTMLIFSLKNLCGWSDKQEVSGSLDITNLVFDDDEE